MAGEHKQWLALGEQVLARAPEHPDLLISVARARAANGDIDAASRALADAIGRGAGFELFDMPEFAGQKANPVFAALAERARGGLVPVSPPVVFAQFEDPQLRPEGIAYDPRSQRWFVGSAAGEIWQVDAQARTQRFVASGSGLREVFGMKVDDSRRLLWAATGVFPDLLPTGEAPKADVGITGVQAYDLESGKLTRKCWLDERPTQHGFNDLALARNGEVYITDSTTSTIYRLRPGGCEFEALVRDTSMSFPNGIVLAPDQSRLYVAHIEGVSAIDTSSGRRTMLTVPPDAAVNSIDGLAWANGELLGIQSSPYLARVARIRLRADGLAVAGVSVLSSRGGAGLSQTTGVVAGREFFTVAGLPNVLAQNQPPDGAKFPQILRTPLP